MDTTEMFFLGLVLTAFATFSATVMWVIRDDVRHRATRATRADAANDRAATPNARAA